jgi:hypothetical protein
MNFWNIFRIAAFVVLALVLFWAFTAEQTLPSATTAQPTAPSQDSAFRNLK